MNHKGFNSLAVGNHDDTAGAMSGDSVFRNPVDHAWRPRASGDRGERHRRVGQRTDDVGHELLRAGNGRRDGAAAGRRQRRCARGRKAAARFSWRRPDATFAAARGGRTSSARIDARDGAGAVDAQSGVAIAQQRRWRDAPATRRGWDVGTLSSAVFGSDRLATFRYRVAVPALILFPRVKVALAWDSAVTSAPRATRRPRRRSPSTSTCSCATAAACRSRPRRRGTTATRSSSSPRRRGETYEIVIRRWSGTDSVWFGVAWTVTGLEWWLPFVPAGLFEVALAGR